MRFLLNSRTSTPTSHHRVEQARPPLLMPVLDFRMRAADMRRTPRMRLVSRLAHSAIVISAACGRPDAASLKTVAASLPPFDSLAAVHLGMSVRALKRVRPTTPSPYVGLAEQTDSARIEYRFGHDAPDEGEPHGPLSTVTVRYSFRRAQPAESLAAERFDTLVHRIGQPSSCRRRVAGTTGLARARWIRFGQLLELVRVQNPEDEAARTNVAAYAVLEIVSDDTASTLTAGSLPELSAADCALAFHPPAR